MAYYLTFFARAGEENGASALGSFLSRLAETGDRLLVERRSGDYVDEVAVCHLATDNGRGAPSSGWLTVQLYVGVEFNADGVIGADPDNAYGVWGSDLQVDLTLGGEAVDWPLVERVWTTLEELWSAVAWDETSGFEINADRPRPA